MKRLIGSIVFAALISSAFGQASFSIYQPKNEQTIKERAVVKIPKNAIPANSYVGIYLNDRFLEARPLKLNGAFYEYVLDTKGKAIADGKYELKMVLFQDMGEQTIAVAESKRTVYVANSSSIKVPTDGMLLRYKFRNGAQYMYRIEQKVNVSTITEAQAKMGSRAAMQEVDSERFRMLFAVDNTYGNGDGLIRMQPAPDKGKDYAVLTMVGESEPKAYYDYMMHPLYMRLSSTGLEQYGSAPFYVPLEGTGGESSRLDLFASFPLPTLPSRKVRPGDSWESRFQFGNLDLDNLHKQASIVSKSQARGEFVGVEWEMGRPCARIKLSIAAGSPVVNAVAKSGMGGDRMSVEQNFWFDISNGVVVKSVLDFTIDQRVVVQPQGTGAGGGGGAANSGGGGGANSPLKGGAGLSSSGGDHRPAGQGDIPKDLKLQGRGKGDGDEGGPARGGNPQGPGRLGSGGSQTGGRQGGPATGAVRFVRTRIQLSMVLDQ